MSKKKITIIICTAIIIILCAAAAIILLPNKSSVSVTEMLSTAQKYLIETDYERAIAEFNKVIELDPMNAEAYLGLAEAYEKNGQHDMAVETLEKGYELTGDERIRAALEALLNSEDADETETVTAAAETVLTEATSYKSGDIAPMESYSDGTKRSEMIYTDDNGTYDIVYYFYQGAELLRESYSAEGDLISAAADFSFIEEHPIGEMLYKDLTDISESGYTLKRGTTSVNVSGDRALFSFADNDMYGITYRSLTFDDDGKFIYKCNNMGLYSDPYSCVTSYYTDGKTESTIYYNDTVVMGTSAGTFELSGDSYKTDRILGSGGNYYRYNAECADGTVTEKRYSRSGRYLGYTEEYAENSTLYSNYYYANGELNIHSEYDADSGTRKYSYYDNGLETDNIIDYYNNGIWTSKNTETDGNTATYEVKDNILTTNHYDENGELYSEIKTDFVNRTTRRHVFGNDYYNIDTKENWYYDDNGVRITETYYLNHYDWNEEKEIYYDEPFHSSTYKCNYITGEQSETYYDFDGSITSVSEGFSNDDGIQITESRSPDGILLSKSEYDTADGSRHTYQYDENGTLINEETH